MDGTSPNRVTNHFKDIHFKDGLCTKGDVRTSKYFKREGNDSKWWML